MYVCMCVCVCSDNVIHVFIARAQYASTLHHCDLTCSYSYSQQLLNGGLWQRMSAGHTWPCRQLQRLHDQESESCQFENFGTENWVPEQQQLFHVP